MPPEKPPRRFSPHLAYSSLRDGLQVHLVRADAPFDLRMYSVVMHWGADNQELDRHDQWVAGICALLAHAFLFMLLLHSAGSGQGNYQGNNIGRGDSLTVYPILLTPSAVKTSSISPIQVPITDAVASGTQPSNLSSAQTISSPSPDITPLLSQTDLNTRTNAPQSKKPSSSVQTTQATARNATSASSGGNAGDDLLSSYQAAMRAAIFKTWQDLSKRPYPIGCTIHLSQNPGGAVTATSAATCGLSREDQLQLEAAALMAQPMPYAGYESVFSTEMDLTL